MTPLLSPRQSLSFTGKVLPLGSHARQSHGIYPEAVMTEDRTMLSQEVTIGLADSPH